MTVSTHFSTAIFQEDVDVFLVLEMVIKVHNVFMVQRSVQLNFSVNLVEGKKKVSRLKVKTILRHFVQFRPSAHRHRAARLPSPAGAVWRPARVG